MAISSNDMQILSVAINRVQASLSNLLESSSALNRTLDLIYNQETSNAANIATVSARLTTLENVVNNTAETVDGLPQTEYAPTLASIISTQQQILTQLSNIENAILAVPSSSVFQAMAQQLDNIQAAVGYPPPGQDLWSRVSTITTVTVGDETAKVRVYGSVIGSTDCGIFVNVYDCLSNSKITSTEVDATTKAFQVYVLPGRYVFEFVGETIATKSVTADIPTGVTEYNLT